jgi:hypothetical protein
MLAGRQRDTPIVGVSPEMSSIVSFIGHFAESFCAARVKGKTDSASDDSGDDTCK